MRWLRTSLKILAVMAGVLVLLCGSLVIYLLTHKDKVLQAAEEQLRAQINGDLHIAEADLKATAHLPGVAISLRGVEIRDGRWQQHHQTLLKADQFFITINFLPLLTGKVRMGRLEMRNGQVCVYTDSTGYSNTSAFGKRKKDEDSKMPEIDNVALADMNIIIRHEAKNKDFDFAAKYVNVKRKTTDDGWNATVQMDLSVRSMAFNTDKGSFLEGKHLAATLKCSYSDKEHAITIPLQELRIDEESINARGKFTFTEGAPARFELYFGTAGIRYKEALTLITPGISYKIPSFDFANPIAVQATLIGHAAYRDTPHVHIAWQVRDNTFTTPAGTITHCSFRGSYDNERVPGAGHKDPNALVTVAVLKGNWEGIDVTVDTLSIVDLVNPVLEGRAAANGNVRQLNNVAGESAFLFTGGRLKTDISFKGSLNGRDTAQPYIRGTMNIEDAAVTYRPRGIRLTNTNARIRFAGSDVIVDTLTISCGTTSIGLQGTFKEFLNLFYLSPEKIVMNWDLRSRLVNMSELMPLLKQRQYTTTKRSGNHLSGITQQLGEIIANNVVSLNVEVDKVEYENFAAQKVSCGLVLDSTGFTIKNAKLGHAGGAIAADASLTRENKMNKYVVDARIYGVNISPFFRAFDDFGQGAVTHNEIDGEFSANVSASGYLNDDGQPVKRSINGRAGFSLRHGRLVDFAPMKTIGTLLFRRRQMDSIAFREISDTLTIKDGKIFVPPLHIESNAINLMVKGVYATAGKGTNLEIDVPLRNPNKDSMITDEAARHARHMKGIVLHLRATKNDSGDLKISFR